MSLIDEVDAYMESQGLAGQSVGWPIYHGTIPDDHEKDATKRKVAHRAVGLFHRGGGRPEVRAGVRWPELFIQLRGEPGRQRETRERAEIILAGLNGKGEPPDFLSVRSLDAKSDVNDLGPDEHNRPQFTMSFEALLQ